MGKLSFEQKSNIRVLLFFIFLFIVIMCALASCTSQKLPTKAQTEFHHKELMKPIKFYYVAWCDEDYIYYWENDNIKTIENIDTLMLSPYDIMIPKFNCPNN